MLGNDVLYMSENLSITTFSTYKKFSILTLKHILDYRTGIGYKNYKKIDYKEIVIIKFLSNLYKYLLKSKWSYF